ncbi:hypothetical protein, partial [Brucella sp. 22210]|uniref:hypothetical protein n=1 Tax=Brucella sp. 22210 TaxID=3453892 RepID=UPI003F84A31B
MELCSEHQLFRPLLVTFTHASYRGIRRVFQVYWYLLWQSFPDRLYSKAITTWVFTLFYPEKVFSRYPKAGL